jgi:hypothetical protein
MIDILEELKKDSNIGKAIDQIIEDLIDIDEMQSKLIILVKKYLETRGPTIDKISGKKVNFKDEEIEHNIAKFTRHLVKKHEDIDGNIVENDIIDDRYAITKKTKMAIKKRSKSFQCMKFM